jgi:hypothetical protein
VGFLMESLPIARPNDSIRNKVETAVNRVIDFTRQQRETRQTVLDWLQVEYEIVKPSTKLQLPTGLDCDTFVAEVRKVRGKKKPLSAAGLANLRHEYARTIEPACAIAAEALTLENQISNLVNEAYCLTPEEVALMWHTAPPRMPVKIA